MKHIKTFESFNNSIDNVEKIDEGILADFGHFLGLDSATRAKIKSDLKKIDIKDESAVDKLFFKVFDKETIKGVVKPALNNADIDEKLSVLKQASKDKDGIGVLAVKDGKLAYKPSGQVKWSSPGADSMSKPKR